LKSSEVLQVLFSESIMDLRYYWLRKVELDGMSLIVARTGWSSEFGYEIYLQDKRGAVNCGENMAAGAEFDLKPSHTSSIRRVEGEMFSYHADADIKTNPYELGLERLVNIDITADFIGKMALNRIREIGVTRKQFGLRIDAPPSTGPNTTFWPVMNGAGIIGKVISAVYSPRLKHNISHAMVSIDCAEIGVTCDIDTAAGTLEATVVVKNIF